MSVGSVRVPSAYLHTRSRTLSKLVHRVLSGAHGLVRYGSGRSFSPNLAFWMRCPMTHLGHEDPFPPPELSACYVIGQGTFAGTHGNGRDAPIPAVRGGAIGALASTLTGPSRPGRGWSGRLKSGHSHRPPASRAGRSRCPVRSIGP